MMKNIMVAVLLLTVLFIAACATQAPEAVPQVDPVLQAKAALYDKIIDGFATRPVTPNLPNHVYRDIGEGAFVFLHFDKAVAEAAELWYTGVAYPGKFCAEDQAEMNAKYGEGFTHFHKKLVDKPGATPQDGHGGDGGEIGYWFKHVSVTTHQKPWGTVTPGVDLKFMPTPPPSCAELGIEGY
ncbi:MAG: hypothetical protein ACE5FT_04310 [Candidatus Nanoarchaeia archaeon]